MKDKKQNFKNKLKVGIAGLLLGSTLIAGTACATNNINVSNTENSLKITETESFKNNSVENIDVRQQLVNVVNKTFNNYITVEGQNAGGTIILEDGTAVTRRIGCVTAPNGDNIAWFGDEYYAIYKDGKAFLNENENPEECEMYISFKDALMDIVTDNYHEITKIGNNKYQIDDNDCNIYIIEVKNGVISNIKNTYIDFNTSERHTSQVYLHKTNEQEFYERLEDAILDIEQANEYFNNNQLTK